MSHYSKNSKRQRKIRQKVIDRDGYSCVFCERSLLLNEITLDHIVPKSKRGSCNATNLTVCCNECNNDRGSQDFFQYAANFNWDLSKYQKYQNLYYSNLKIKVLSIALNISLSEEYVVPKRLIQEACDVLKIRTITFQEYFQYLTIDFKQSLPRNLVVINFENLIKMLENSII